MKHTLLLKTLSALTILLSVGNAGDGKNFDTSSVRDMDEVLFGGQIKRDIALEEIKMRDFSYRLQKNAKATWRKGVNFIAGFEVKSI